MGGGGFGLLLFLTSKVTKFQSPCVHGRERVVVDNFCCPVQKWQGEWQKYGINALLMHGDDLEPQGGGVSCFFFILLVTISRIIYY